MSLFHQLARTAATQPPDPFKTTAVYAFGQLFVATDARHRLVAVGVYNPGDDDVLVDVVGTDPYGEWKAGHNERQKARRARSRAARACL